MKTANNVVGGELFTVSVDGDGLHIGIPSEVVEVIGEDFDFDAEEREVMMALAIRMSALIVIGKMKRGAR